MIRRIAIVGLVVLAVLAPISAGLILRERPARPVPLRSTSGDTPVRIEDRSTELIRLASAGTPFRLWHRTPSLRFGVVQGPPMAAAPTVPRPHPVLTGLVWGGRPSALLEGIPGHEGAVVMSKGDTAGGLRVMVVGPDRVTLTGMDTSWTLTVRQPWP